MAWTLLDIREKVASELDLQDEDFIDDTEFATYVNDAIRECEAEIHKVGLEDEYFLASTPLTFVLGIGDYDLPDDIYAMKIKGILYQNGDTRYDIKRFRGTHRFDDFQFYRTYGTSSTEYRYILTNNRATGPQIAMAPVSQVAGAYGTIWYIRNALELVDDTDVCDIPEFINFVLQYVRDKCINKERMMLDAPPSAALETQRQLMIATLNEQVPDGDNELEQDTSHYEDSV